VLDHQSALSNIPPEAGLCNLVAASGVNGLPGDQGIPGTAADAVAAICVVLGSTAGCDLVNILAPDFFKRVFLTSTLHDGNLGGLEGADVICQAQADDNDINGVFKAWLSDGTDSPDNRFAHVSVKYTLVDDNVVASSYADLSDGSLSYPINLTADGKYALTGATWTGTDAFGASIMLGTCNGWTIDGAFLTGLRGHNGHNGLSWTDLEEMSCSESAHLYCMEQ
jgi:hypothetical protein